MRCLERAVQLFVVVFPTAFVVGGVIPDYPLSDMDLKIGGGYFTSGGWYAGGIPKILGETQSYDMCMEFQTADESTNGTSSLVDVEGTMCTQWVANKPKETDETSQMDWCRCMFNNPYFCEDWACSTMMVSSLEFCGEGEIVADDDDSFRRDRRLAECNQFISHDSSRCYCEKGYKVGRLFCPIWTCDTYLEDVLIKETVECITASANGLFCETWSGTVIGDDFYGTTACACTQASAGPDGTCALSTCVEKGIKKCSVCSLATSVAGFGIAGALGLLALSSRCNAGDRKSPGLFLCIIWMLGASAGAAVYGGVWGSIYVGIMWVGTVVLYILCFRPAKEQVSHAKPLASVNR